MAVKKKAEPAAEEKVIVTTEYTVRDQFKDYSYIMVGSRLIPIEDGKIKAVNKDEVKDFIV